MILRVNNAISRIELARSAAEKEQLENNLSKAQQIHGVMGNLDRDIESISVCEYYKSAEVAGGDWIGLEHNSKNNRLYLLMGDVTGHGMTSALVTVAVAGAVRGSLKMIIESKNDYSLSEEVYYLAKSTNSAVLDSSKTVQKGI